MLKVASLLELVDKVRGKIPNGRAVRAIYGALENPTPPSKTPDSTRLQSDEEVEAFLDVTSSKPVRLQIVGKTLQSRLRQSQPARSNEYYTALLATGYYDPTLQSQEAHHNDNALGPLSHATITYPCIYAKKPYAICNYSTSSTHIHVLLNYLLVISPSMCATALSIYTTVMPPYAIYYSSLVMTYLV